MWNKWIRELNIKFQWIKRNRMHRWKLDIPTGVMGMIMMTSALLLFIVVGSGIARIFRSLVPWVPGSRVEEIYWYSISFGLKASFLFIIFSAALISFLHRKFSKRR